MQCQSILAILLLCNCNINAYIQKLLRLLFKYLWMDHTQIFSIWLQFGGYENTLVLENHALVTLCF